MQNAETILVIMLAVVLIVFLILAIIGMVISIKTMKSINRIVGKAEHVVDTAGAAAEILKDSTGKLALIRIVNNIVKMATKDKEK